MTTSSCFIELNYLKTKHLNFNVEDPAMPHIPGKTGWFELMNDLKKYTCYITCNCMPIISLVVVLCFISELGQ